MRIALILLGIIEVIIPLFILLFLLPQIYSLQQGLDQSSMIMPFAFVYFGFMLTIGATQIIRGIFVKNGNPKTSKSLLVAGSVILLFLIPAMYILIINPIYSLLESF